MSAKTCPHCHAVIPAGAPGDLCPACVLRGADELVPAVPAGAPPLEEVRAAFPMLEVQDLIGQGGMGFVYKARQPALDRMVALKILAPSLGGDPAFAERFAREARALGKLSHPNIVTVFEHGVTRPAAPGMPFFYYLLMEYVDGVNLRQAMRAGRFTPGQALGVVPAICDALQAAHAQGIWHRDIKPENILLDSRGGVKIADFGIARMVGDPRRDFVLTVTGAALGSAAYMAPEQHEKPHDVDHRADIYSLGVVIYEMLTGELPLGRFPVPSQRAAVDARIDEIVLRTLEKERALRQQSAEEVKTDVRQASEPLPPRVDAASGAGGLLPLSVIALITGFVMLLGAGLLTHGYAQGKLLAVSLAPLVAGLAGVLVHQRRSRRAGLGRPVSWLVASVTLVAVLANGLIYQEWRRKEGARYPAGGVPGKDWSGLHGDSVEEPEDFSAGKPTTWAAHFKQGELARLRGDFQAALRSYELALLEEKPGQENEPPFREKDRRWRTGRTLMRAGDAWCALGDFKKAEKSYTGAIAVLDPIVPAAQGEIGQGVGEPRKTLGTLFLKTGEVLSVQGDRKAANENFRAAIAVLSGYGKGDRWGIKGDNLEGGYDLTRPFDEEELADLAQRNPGKIDYGSSDWQRLRWLMGLASAYKSERFRYLLEDKAMAGSHLLSVAALDWSLNRNAKALDFLLTRLTAQRVGNDSDEPVVLSFINEWNRSAPAVEAHFVQADGAGGISEGDFWLTRQYLFPRHYLAYKFPGTEGAPLPSPPVPQQAKPAPVIIMRRPTEWRITDAAADGRPASAFELQGDPKAEKTTGDDYCALTVHIGGNPVFMVAGKGYASSTQYQSSTGHLSGHLSEIENIRIDFEISSGDKATLNQRVYDLTLGRVFLVRPDGSLRQIPLRPERVVQGKDLKEFIAGLPPGK